MNGAHFHLLVNHIPIVGTIFGMLILLAGIILKNTTVKLTGLATLIAATISVSFALLSGDPAGEAVEGLPGVTEAMVEHHESIAYSSLWGMIPMALIAGLSFYSIIKKEKAGNTLSIITLFLALIVTGLMSWVGLTGGEIRHTEIRNSGVVQPSGTLDADESEENE
ncbi:MAG: hypothetical protein IPH84_08970 [Bacteroidales bacterium]|nr:hypothetical protein [Bacteroidales bacterium]